MAREDIGVAYQLVGSVILLGTCGIVGWGVYAGHAYSKIDGLLVGGLIVASLALLRPDWLDNLVKTVVDKLPFFKYTKPDA